MADKRVQDSPASSFKILFTTIKDISSNAVLNLNSDASF